MGFKLKTPCSDCPFRKDKYFELHKEGKIEIHHSLMFQDQTFSCHKTVNYEKWDEEGEYRPTDGEQHCAGALIVMRKMGTLLWNFMYRLAVMENMLDLTKLDMEAPVYDSMEQWIDATEQIRDEASDRESQER